jgi:hypothetical protein
LFDDYIRRMHFLLPIIRLLRRINIYRLHRLRNLRIIYIIIIQVTDSTVWPLIFVVSVSLLIIVSVLKFIIRRQHCKQCMIRIFRLPALLL